MKKDDRLYVGIDFSKEKFNACLRMNLGVSGEAEFPNTRAGYLKLIRWVKKTSELASEFSYDNVLFCGEHTGLCSLGLSEYLYEKGIRMWLENPLSIKYGSGIQRIKNDKADAEMIAVYAERFYTEGTTPLFRPETDELKKLRSLYMYRERIVHDRVAVDNAIKAGTYDSSPVALCQMKRRLREGIEDEKAIRKEMISLMAVSTDLGQNYRLLTSIKGVGPITAAVLLIHTSNFTRFSTPRKFACFSGVAPFGRQSGTTINTNPHVSHYANHTIKAALTEAAKAASRFNPALREYATRLRLKGKHEGIVLNNIKNKLIHIIFKIIVSGKPWSEDYQPCQMSGNQNQRPLGIKTQKRAAATAPSADLSAQTSPSTFGDAQIYEFLQKNSKMSKNNPRKICI